MEIHDVVFKCWTLQGMKFFVLELLKEK